MIRALVRFYSLHRRAPARGCRVLDYTNPKTHLSVALPAYLLGARTGHRYDNQVPAHDDRLELLTILSMYQKRPDIEPARTPSREPELASQFPTSSREGLYARLGLDDHIPPREVDFASLNVSEDLRAKLELWSDIILAPDLAQALSLARGHTHPRMQPPAQVKPKSSELRQRDTPPFVALHVLSRHAASPLDVHNALRQFELWLPNMPSHIQPELVVLMLKMAQRQLVDVVPSIIQLFIVHNKATPRLAPSVVNELLWQIARYGKRWSLVDTPVLSQAQELLLTAAGVDIVDIKGLVALTYIKHFRNPELARQAMVDLTAVVANRTPIGSQREFAYSAGPLVMRLLTAPSAEEALLVVDEAKTHLPAVWAALAMYLSRNQLLRPDVAWRLWNKLWTKINQAHNANHRRPSLRVSNLLTELVLDALPNLSQKQQVLAQALNSGLRLTPSLVAKMMKVRTAHDLETALHAYAEFADHPLVLEQVLQTQTHVDPAKVWSTYCRLLPSAAEGGGVEESKGEGLPSRNALKSLCRAAWDVRLLWDGMYAAQRALREIKLHVRGAAAPADDILRLFPTDELLYTYVVMAGRSGYHDELLAFLPWMKAIQHDPAKRVLLALIYYSPQGAALLRLGQNLPHSQWPTEDEYEVYKTMMK